jgi:SHS2 domain-containing protein
LFIQGSGDSLADAVEAVAHGLFSSISSSEQTKRANCIAITFEEKGTDFQDLIINIFTRVLAEMDINSKIGYSLQIIEIDSELNTAKLKLMLCDGRAKLHVKAVTYHDFSILTEGTKTKIKVLFDI